MPQSLVVHEERHEPAEHPRRARGHHEVAGEAPPAQQQHGDDQQADRPQRGQLVEDQEEGAGAVRDRIEQPDDGFLGRGRVVRVEDERDEHQRRDHRPGSVAGAPAGRALAAIPGGDVAEVGQQRPDGAHSPPCHA